MLVTKQPSLFDHTDPAQPGISIVVIGRNEGQRLARCLTSITRVVNVSIAEVIYVDSASTDGSPELAATHGAVSIPVYPERPTAAVGRNAGWRRAASDLVLFLDGDTILHPDFPRAACDTLLRNNSIAAVWGHRRELYPERSIFNRVLDLDWIYPPGDTEFCGGDVLMRRSVLAEVGGFDEELIAGEEPELCRRIRERGFKITHIDRPMTGHDLNMTNGRQYWKRAVRAGHAYAEVSERFRNMKDPFWSSEQKANALRAAFWIGSFAITILAMLQYRIIAPACWLALFLAASLRSAWKARWRTDNLWTLLFYGLHSQLQQIPIAVGQLRFALSKSRNGKTRLIEYKTN